MDYIVIKDLVELIELVEFFSFIYLHNHLIYDKPIIFNIIYK